MESTTDNGASISEGSRKFVAEVARYYRDFLETDFRKARAPGRQVKIRDENGNTFGFNVRRYPDLLRAIHKLLEDQFLADVSLSVRRGQYTATVSRNVQVLLATQVQNLDDDELRSVVNQCVFSLKKRAEQGRSDFDSYVEEAMDLVSNRVMQSVVQPLIVTLEGVLARTPSINAKELLYEIEDDIAEHIVAAIRENLPDSLVQLVENDDMTSLLGLLNESIGPDALKEFLTDFFGNLATGDAYEDLLALAHTLRLDETLELYLYVLDLLVKPHQFPVAYIPIRLEKAGDQFFLHFDNRLFFNRRALKHVVDHSPDAKLRVPGPPTNDRIHFLFESSPLSLLEDTILALTDAYRLPERIQIRSSELALSRTQALGVSNAMHVCAFSKSEEAIVNDYEEILVGSKQENSALSKLFEKLINGCILEEPRSVRPAVEAAWDNTPRDVRLIYESPVPLNEEQRKLMLAQQNPNCRYLVVEGPPGTGKSHTITAMVFEAIMRKRSVLVLSDKNEALDVVEDKLTQALNRIRPGDDFQNPILRLGRSTGTYAKILQKSTKDRIQRYFQAAKPHRERARKSASQKSKQVKTDINNTVAALSSVDINDIVEYERLLAGLSITDTYDLPLTQGIEDLLRNLILGLPTLPEDSRSELASIAVDANNETQEFGIKVKQRIVESRASQQFGDSLNHLAQFERMDTDQIPWLKTVVEELIDMRNPLFGYLFCRSETKALADQFAERMPLSGLQPPHKRRKSLLVAARMLTELSRRANELKLSPAHLEETIQRLRRGPVSSSIQDDHLDPVRLVIKLEKQGPTLLKTVWKSPPTLKNWIEFEEPTRSPVEKCYRLVQLHLKLTTQFGSVPSLDLQRTQEELQNEHTAELAHVMDERLIDFIDNNHALATTLKSLIAQRQPFPRDRFDQLKDAFPVIIAGIRDFADYIPLEADIVDLVIIDEASQVSIAQALPALLRAKQVVVLGDEKQFANVKTSTASKTVNQGYMHNLEAVFRANFDVDNEKLERMRNFDVRTSILRFFDLIKHFDVMLRKHFRGYSELISFSSKYFYDHQLQAIRIRARPVDEVLRFSVLDDESAETAVYRNANQSEASFVEKELVDLLELEEPPSVGVITPFREQQKLVTHQLLFESQYSEDFQERLSLKVMTFDTCQGEERDVIYYTMAATKEHDRLNYIFPTELQNWIEGSDRLKAQRLNVGFSRAKETIHFVLSKEIDQFKGTVREVLRHYKKELRESRTLPTVDQVDPNSPMEAQVLHWLRDTAFYRENSERIEVVPQFPIGDYLKQLDPYYEHPRYRVDFLVLFGDLSGRKIPVIIEYDGFREHFKQDAPVDETNYEHYYREEDVERQFILESYGYNFLRVNRFNLGQDPIATLSDRLYRLVGTRVTEATPSEHTEAVNKMVVALESGEAKMCSKCGKPKAVGEFSRPELKSGYGRYCNNCNRRNR